MLFRKDLFRRITGWAGSQVGKGGLPPLFSSILRLQGAGVNRPSQPVILPQVALTLSIMHHASHITFHTSHITLTHHTSRITHHASHITHHASHITHYYL